MFYEFILQAKYKANTQEKSAIMGHNVLCQYEGVFLIDFSEVFYFYFYTWPCIVFFNVNICKLSG